MWGGEGGEGERGKGEEEGNWMDTTSCYSMSTLSFAAFQDIQDTFDCNSVVRDLSIWWLSGKLEQKFSCNYLFHCLSPLSLSLSLSLSIIYNIFIVFHIHGVQ